MRQIGIIVAIVAAIGGALWYQGLVTIPGYPSPGAASREKSDARSLKPPADPAPRESEKTARPSAPQPKVEKTPVKPTETAKPKNLGPPVTNEDVRRAEALWQKADFAGVTRALAGVERGTTPLEEEAWKLATRAKLVQPLVAKIQRSPLASGDLEQVELASGGKLLGKVVDQGEKVRIIAMGGAETVIDKEDLGDRKKVGKDVLAEKVRARLKEKEARAKGGDALTSFRFAAFCWTYGLETDAVPYLAKALEDDAFPTVAQVFGGDKGDELASSWYAYSGKERPTPRRGEATAANRPASPPPSGSPPPVASRPGDTSAIGRARTLYDKAVARYRVSFTDSRDAEPAVKDARKILAEALEVLETAGDSAEADTLRMECSRLLADCRKHGGM